MRKIEKFLRSLTFNIRRDKELDLNRRGFVASALSLMGIFFLSSTPLVVLSKKIEKESNEFETLIAAQGDLAVGDSVAFSYPKEHDPALLIRISETEYRAYNIKCTHLMCPVYWEKEDWKLVCPCHHGFFDVEDGSVLAGPPQRALPTINLAFKDNGIYAVSITQAQH
ncbi:ubiquinol-cytochrome c reductase iron-sulfur subunit [Anaerobacillus isosaccharinicus]|uniref:Rieske (2Fe-2S) protein n=1 Tax=Anaerobacillus isosaccharinicus TaxID=1532552 RepID=A0A1S2LHD1_9BACI|nr:Rieske (2Fe-2S) protein [Anaerobacillus isosaccharinicus]MBA5586595.1 Rieske (2Fe-2S) protein [Anaerobacillus isosaccharinicus]QOY35169.1 Rieske (2Fe-2S) protein [Anaerobacillus isosaccharinicus]